MFGGYEDVDSRRQRLGKRYRALSGLLLLSVAINVIVFAVGKRGEAPHFVPANLLESLCTNILVNVGSWGLLLACGLFWLVTASQYTALERSRNAGN